ncbi:unnamed protein product, partial [Rotaria sp. Silwood1]
MLWLTAHSIASKENSCDKYTEVIASSTPLRIANGLSISFIRNE